MKGLICMSKNVSKFQNLTLVDVIKLADVHRQMLRRCNNPNCHKYYCYGNRGIYVCDEWDSDNPEGLDNFMVWADQNNYHPGLTLDRIDNDGPYSEANCRFADYIAQANNRSNNHLITYGGKTHTIAQWAVITGIPASTLCTRIRRGWSVERALNTSPSNREHESK